MALLELTDLHNYGAYWAAAPWGDGYRKPLGGGHLTTAHFANLWKTGR